MRLEATPTQLAAQSEFCKAVLHGAGALSQQQLRSLADKLHEMAGARRAQAAARFVRETLPQDDRTVWL